MSRRKRSLTIAGIALLAVGAMLGAWITAQTGQFPLKHTTAAAASPADVALSNAALQISFQTGFGPIIKQVQPAVVSVTSKQTIHNDQTSQNSQNQDPIFRFFSQIPGLDGSQIPGLGGNIPDQQREGLGSGVIVSQDGYILTNNHVVDNADEVKVLLQDGRSFDAKIIGTDAPADLAVLKIDASGLPTVRLGDSSNVGVGDFVLAMGNPFGIGQTVTMGIVGATSRNVGISGNDGYENFIQTDAAINPGNSGGALVNAAGELIGINTAIISRNGGGNEGVGFAIPVNMAHNVMNQIIDHGKVSRGWLGVSIQPVTPEIAESFKLPGDPRGALVGDVNAGSPAEKAGLQRGDIVVSIDGKEVADSQRLRLMVADLMPNTRTNLSVYRDGTEKQVAVVLGERPDNPSEPAELGSAPQSETPRLGVSVQPTSPNALRQFGLPSNTSGLVITNVAPNSAAADAGLQAGDVIQEVNRTRVTDAAAFESMVRNANGRMLLLINRGGSTLYVTVRPR